MFTVRLIVRVRGTKRIIKTFIRSEYALNTLSHADTFETLGDAEIAADALADDMSSRGHTVIGADFYEHGKFLGKHKL